MQLKSLPLLQTKSLRKIAWCTLSKMVNGVIKSLLFYINDYRQTYKPLQFYWALSEKLEETLNLSRKTQKRTTFIIFFLVARNPQKTKNKDLL